ncbi:hypothetical protein E3P92_00745 [Wallemia ichthyophaga]|uniref:Uncharacterized protein n=1 Tax=Wallemia ichthyophaga TaxID=245174 RepID=A0A4T0HPN9_WALIC|nr:hypothetical protein E3P91_00354 [Wallemia ichthyophaga]TIA83549.1 hypothetical protein E3P98_00726 [Wallemia ichthyophaga]TIA93864.1 hypothetical protein E3P97_00651 [Wallemia ichthyophaga]TIB03107.1 hypothetical protein E3P95_00700 [Wallemia ichthyophaga]TIB04001.1 hypothetical protein E3P94_00832 [Wallemia ichthyophaga]
MLANIISKTRPVIARQGAWTPSKPVLLMIHRNQSNRQDRTSEQELAERQEQPQTPPPTANTGQDTTSSDKIHDAIETDEADAVHGPLKGKGGKYSTPSQEELQADKGDYPTKSN